jgi:ribose transport system substrate-binding protein
MKRALTRWPSLLILALGALLAACGGAPASPPTAAPAAVATEAPKATEAATAAATAAATEAATEAATAAATEAATAAATEAATAGTAVDLSKVKIVVSMKGPGGGNPFWAAVQAGAEEAGKALGVSVTVQAPPTESDVAAQIAQIEDDITKGVTAIAIAPTDPAALEPVLKKAIDAGIKVVFIDTKGQNAGVTFIGTNNEVGAALAGKYMCDNLKPGDKVAIIQGIITQSTGKARADGSKAAVTGCGLNLVAEVPADFDKAKGQAAMEDILTKNPDLKGVFASNDNMALGATEAIKSAKLTGKILVVGFDANPDAATAILAGEMNATIAQSPANIGKFGVESLLKLIQGETLDPVIDTGTELVTKDNAAKYK